MQNLNSEFNSDFKEFAKSRAMRAMRAYVPKACQHFSFTCQRAKDVPFFKLACQRAKRRANFSTIFQKKKMFQLWLTFANFNNIWAILNNLSRETKNLKQKILTFACFSLHIINLASLTYYAHHHKSC